MPFGLCNAPRGLCNVLADLEWGNCLVYLDDILIISHTFEEHIQLLAEVFERLRKLDFDLN